MFKKINSTTLIIILVVLGGIWAVNKFYLAKRSESTFNDVFVKIDSSKISQILIYPKAENGKEINLTKQANGWQLQYNKIKTTADPVAVQNIVNSFAEIKSNALAASDRSSWKEYQIDDSSGTRIKIITNDNKTYDMVVGKFGYNPATRNGISYVRRKDEEPVYAVDGFLSFGVNKPFNSWRNKTLVSGNKENWNSLTFTYSGEGSFVLSKQNNTWMVNGQTADSAKTAQYLSGLSRIQNNNFVESYTPSSAAVYTLTIKGNNQAAPITVQAFPGDSVQKLILHSSINSDAYFSDGNTGTAQKMFVQKENFLSGGN